MTDPTAASFWHRLDRGLARLRPRREPLSLLIDALMVVLNVPFAAAAFWFGTALEFAGCAMLLFDVYPAIGVGCLMVFTVVSTAIFHRFYNYDDPFKKKISRIAVLANTGVLGGLMLLLQNVR